MLELDRFSDHWFRLLLVITLNILRLTQLKDCFSELERCRSLKEKITPSLSRGEQRTGKLP